MTEIHKDRLSSESINFIRSCLRSCSVNHTHCRQWEGDGQRPGRLLRVGGRYDGNVSLVESHQMAAPNSPYVAFSYCWGNVVSFRTTHQTLPGLIHGVKLDIFPKAFIDAVHLTRRLGVPYLWIDALCIIQDSIDDWEAESAKMASIYANAYITIAAASNQNAAQPFLGHAYVAPTKAEDNKQTKSEESPSANKTTGVDACVDQQQSEQSEANPENIAISAQADIEQPQGSAINTADDRAEDNRTSSDAKAIAKEGEEQKEEDYERRVFSGMIRGSGRQNEQVWLKARIIPQTGIHWAWDEDHEERTPKDALSRRAWTLQEQILSARLLSISANEMQWTCREAEICECRSQLNAGRQLGRKPIIPEGSNRDVFRFWHKVVENYSMRTLTFSLDKLPAISGVADIVQRRTKSNYAAGLWVDNIDRDLLWRRIGPLGDGGRGDSKAPTFAWASADGEIDYYCFRSPNEPYVKSSSVLSIEAFPSRRAPLGRVAGGMLKMEGPLMPAVLDLSSESGWGLVTIGLMAVEFAIDGRLQQMIYDGPDGRPQKTICRWRARERPPRPRKVRRKSSGNQRSASGSASRRSHQGTGRHSERSQAGPSNVKTRPPEPATHPNTEMLTSEVTCWVLKLGAFTPDLNEPESCDQELMILGRSSACPHVYERIGLASSGAYPIYRMFSEANVTTIHIV